MTLAYDEVWVREPRLMVPGQIPVGRVRHRNPLGNLLFATPGNGDLMDSRTGRVGYLQGATFTPQPRNNKYGDGRAILGGPTTGTLMANFDAVASGPIYGKDSGVMSLWARVPVGASSTLNMLFFGADADAVGSGYFYIALGSVSGSFPDESVSFGMDVASGGTASLLMSVQKGHTYYQDGLWHHFVVVVDKASNRFIVDGVTESVGFAVGANNSAFFTNTTAALAYLRVAGRRVVASSTVYEQGADAAVSNVQVFSGVLPESFMKELYTDPWANWIPA